MRQAFLSNWNFVRVLRLALGMLMGVQAIVMRDSLSGVLGAFLLFQAITNTGCCGVSGCATPGSDVHQGRADDISFEEIKTKESK